MFQIYNGIFKTYFLFKLMSNKLKNKYVAHFFDLRAFLLRIFQFFAVSSLRNHNSQTCVNHNNRNQCFATACDAFNRAHTFQNYSKAAL
jgi:hypothetical protein